MLDIGIFVVLVISFTLCAFLAKLFGKGSKKNYPKGPWGVPLFGNLPFLGKFAPKTFMKWQKKYGNCFKIKLGSWNAVVLNGHEAIQNAALFENDAISSRPEFVSMTILKEVNGNEQQITMSPFNETYIKVRSMMVTTLRRYSNKNPAFEEVVCSTAKDLSLALITKGRQGPYDIRNDIKATVSAILYHLTYGANQSDSVEATVGKMVKHEDEFIEFSGSGNPFDVMPWLQRFTQSRIKSVRRFLQTHIDFEDQQIKTHLENLDVNHPYDLVDYFLRYKIQHGDTELGKSVSQSLLRSMKDISANFSSLSSVLSWCIMYMIENPYVQEKVNREIDFVNNSFGSSNKWDKGNFPYALATLYETLRIATTVPLALPHYTSRDIHFMGYNIDKNTVVLFNLYSANYDTEYWVDPETFRPERFIDNDGNLDQDRVRHVISFGLGRRRCAGEFIAKMMLLRIFVTLLEECTFVKPEGEILDFEPVLGFVSMPKPFKVIVKERN